MFTWASLKTIVAVGSLTGIAFVAGAITQAGDATISSDYAAGKVELQRPTSPFEDDGVHVVELGDKLDFQCRFYIDDFFDKSIIWAGANITNPTDTPMFFEYNVAFFNENGELVGCASQGSYGGVEPAQTTQLGSCLITLEPQDIATVRSYQVRVFESTREIGASSTVAAK